MAVELRFSYRVEFSTWMPLELMLCMFVTELLCVFSFFRVFLL
jgi:hypothetical protein